MSEVQRRREQQANTAPEVPETTARGNGSSKGKGSGKGRKGTDTRSGEGNTEARLPEKPPERAWTQMDHFDLLTEFATPAGTVQDVPVWFRGRWRAACTVALERALENTTDRARSGRAWKLLLLRSTEKNNATGKKNKTN